MPSSYCAHPTPLLRYANGTYHEGRISMTDVYTYCAIFFNLSILGALVRVVLGLCGIDV